MTWTWKPMAVLAVLAATAMAVRAQAKPDWSAWQFLVGHWIADEDSGARGAIGDSTFTLELGGQVMVRRNHAAIPAASGRPAMVHDDLLLIFLEDGALRGDYFDNEGHVIHYTGAASADGQSVNLTSVASATGPQYRLSYTRLDGNRLNGRFEMAPPGPAPEFRTYLSWTTHRDVKAPGKAPGTASRKAPRKP